MYLQIKIFSGAKAMTKPFKQFPLLERTGNDVRSMKFATSLERDQMWKTMISHYGITEAVRHGNPVVIIPILIKGSKSKYFRESGLSYAPVKAYKFDSPYGQYRIDFTGNLAHKEANSLIEECWGQGNWPG
jgi:hypothetical protein